MTLLEFRNATYRGIYDAPVTLADGSYAGPPFTPDSLEPPRVELLEGRVARGDVDADGDEDAMELRVESSGGTGRFLHLAVVVDRNGSPRQRRDNQAGDRWRRRELGADRSALASVVVTLELLGDRLIGTAGGNRQQVDLFPSASSEIATDFTLGPVLATRAYCDPLVMAQQDEFLTKLGASYDFGFSAGDLWVRFAADGQVDRLVFQANDRVRISTPCFTAEVPYAFEGGTLRIDRLGVEAWSCAEDDPTHRLLRDLAWVRRAVVDLEDLRLELLADGGTLVFERVG